MNFEKSKVYGCARRSFQRSLGRWSRVDGLIPDFCPLTSDLRPQEFRRSRKDGVAIIIVLGLLALLMLLGVAFTVTMRAERAGAANYQAAAASRHLVWAGLAQAIDKINESMGDDMYPPGDFLVSLPAPGTNWNMQGSSVALLTQQVQPYVPDAILDYIETLASGGLIRSSWVDAGDGNVAYLVLNLSDMLDANHVGGEPRAGGTEAGEVNLTQWLSSTDLDTVVNERSGDPYLILANFRNRHPSLNADYFVTYSRFLLDEVPEGVNQVNLSGSLAELTSQLGEIGGELFSMVRDALPAGVPSSVVGTIRQNTRRYVLANLYQYINNDAAPAILRDGPCFKKVPMLNELYCDPLRFLTWQFIVPLRIETWYPFYDFGDAPGATINGLADVAIAVTLDDGSLYSATNVNMDIELPVPAGRQLHVEQIRLRDGFSGVPALTNDRPMTLTLRLHDLRVEVSGTEVDRIDPIVFQTPPGTMVTPAGTVVGIQFTNQTWEVADPRLNWSSEHWIPSGTPTPGAINEATLQVWNDHPERAYAYPVYVSNEQRFYSPLELGNLLVPDHENGGAFSPWKTLRVFNRFDGAGNIVEPRHRMLTYFTVHTNTVRRGLVNLNSSDPAVIRSAFEGVPFPGPAAGTPAPANITSELAELLIDYRNANGHYGGVADMLDMNWRLGTLLKELPDIELNALAAFSSGLLGVRQNLFLVLVTATEGERMEGTVLRGRARAMALVWRDPLANGQGLHDHFIQYFRWLD